MKRLTLVIFAALVVLGCNGTFLTADNAALGSPANALGMQLHRPANAHNAVGAPPLAVVCNIKADIGLYLRASAGMNSEAVAVIPSGTAVILLGGNEHHPDGGTWTQVRFGLLTGWVNARYLCDGLP